MEPGALAYPALPGLRFAASPVFARRKQVRTAAAVGLGPVLQGVPGTLFKTCRNSPAASGAHGPSSIAICPARTISNLLSSPVGAVPTTGSRALKQAA